MEATGLSPLSRKIYDPIRKKWVEALPEEIVRQKILSHLVNDLGYPPQSIAIEKSLLELLHTSNEAVPNRRIDILCFETKTLQPLLLIECKAVRLEEKMLSQIMGYNAHIGAPLICLANEGEFLLRWKGEPLFEIENHLPSYAMLKSYNGQFTY